MCTRTQVGEPCALRASHRPLRLGGSCPPAVRILPFGCAQWGRGSTWGGLRTPPVSQQLPEQSKALPRAWGRPPSCLFPFRTQACHQAPQKQPCKKRPSQNQLFEVKLVDSLPSRPAAVVASVLFGRLLLDVSETGSLRAAGAAPPQYCSPSALSGPCTLPPAALATSGFTQTPKTSSALSSPPQPVCRAPLLDQRGEQPPSLPTKKDSVHRNPRYRPGLTPNSSFVSSTTHTLV